MQLDREAEREKFFLAVQQYIKSDPEAAAHVANYVQEGLSLALQKSNQRAADFEVALAVLASKRYKNTDSLILEKVSKWKDSSSLKWDWLITKLTADSK